MSSEGDGETGSVILGIVDLLVSEMLSLPYHKTTKRLQTSVVGKRGSGYDIDELHLNFY